MLTVDVLLSPREVIQNEAPGAQPALDAVVVIDVLRMTTNAVSLFANGITHLHVVQEVEDARRVAAETGSLLLGERGGLPPEGFDGGNSPIENAQREYAGRSAVLCTTNGSKLVERYKAAKHLFLGSIVNADAVAAAALEAANSSVTLVCAGNRGALALDDVMAAGCIVRELMKFGVELKLEDSAKLALSTLDDERTLYDALSRTQHGRRLVELGYEEDVRFAAELNSSAITPTLKYREEYVTFSLA